MRAFRKAGRRFTSNPTEAEAAWLKKSNYILAKHNIIPSQAVPRHVALPAYPEPEPEPRRVVTDASGVNGAETSNITLPRDPALGDANFERLIDDCDRLLDDSVAAHVRPAATFEEHKVRLAMATRVKPQVQPRAEASPEKPQVRPEVRAEASPPEVRAEASPPEVRAEASPPEVRAEPADDPDALVFQPLTLRPPPQVRTYDAERSFHTNMTKAWEAIPVERRSHTITFVPACDHQEFAGEDRQGVFERFSINKDGIGDLKHFLTATSSTVEAIDASKVKMLNGDIYDAEHDLIVNHDDDLLSTASHMLRSSYPQHHFEELVKTLD